MLGITSINDIAELERRKVVIGVFLATGYDHKEIEWLQKSLNEIHSDSGERWHFLVPTKDKSIRGEPADIDFKLANEIRNLMVSRPKIFHVLFSTTLMKNISNASCG